MMGCEVLHNTAQFKTSLATGTKIYTEHSIICEVAMINTLINSRLKLDFMMNARVVILRVSKEYDKASVCVTNPTDTSQNKTCYMAVK